MNAKAPREDFSKTSTKMPLARTVDRRGSSGTVGRASPRKCDAEDTRCGASILVWRDTGGVRSSARASLVRRSQDLSEPGAGPVGRGVVGSAAATETVVGSPGGITTDGRSFDVTRD